MEEAERIPGGAGERHVRKVGRRWGVQAGAPREQRPGSGRGASGEQEAVGRSRGETEAAGTVPFL